MTTLNAGPARPLRTARRLAAAACVVATWATILTVAPADAAAIAPPPTRVSPPPLAPPPPCPTANLNKVAGLVSVRNRSVSAAVIFLANATPPTNPVQLSVDFGLDGLPGSHLQGGDYQTIGNSLRFNFPTLDGAVRSEGLRIKLLEHTAGGAFVSSCQFLRSVTIEPLFDVTISALTFYLINDGDFFGDSDVDLRWNDPTNTRHSAGFSTGAGDTTTIPEFAFLRREVGASAGLLTPAIGWAEDDGPLSCFPHGCPFWGLGASTTPLIPGASRRVSEIQDDAFGQASAQISYTISYNPRYYYL